MVLQGWDLAVPCGVQEHPQSSLIPEDGRKRLGASAGRAGPGEFTPAHGSPQTAQERGFHGEQHKLRLRAAKGFLRELYLFSLLAL